MSTLGKEMSAETKRKIGIANTGERNGMWRGDEAKRIALHAWVGRHLPKPDVCPDCGIRPPYDKASISGEHRRDIGDWRWLCRTCHMKWDRRLYCTNGHRRTMQNTYVSSRGIRRCKICSRISQRRYYEKKPELREASK